MIRITEPQCGCSDSVAMATVTRGSMQLEVVVVVGVVIVVIAQFLRFSQLFATQLKHIVSYFIVSYCIASYICVYNVSYCVIFIVFLCHISYYIIYSLSKPFNLFPILNKRTILFIFMELSPDYRIIIIVVLQLESVFYVSC